MAKSIFDTDEFKPYASEWRERQYVFARRLSYFDGSVYADVRKNLSWLGARVGGQIRGIYQPLFRAVYLDAGIVPAGWALAESSAPLQSAVDTVLRWSDWGKDGSLFVRFGAQYGVSGLKVIDLREKGIVMIKPVDPRTFMLARRGLYDATPRLAVIVESRSGERGERFEYAEVIENERIRTFKDGELFAFDDRKAEYVNALGFVPFVECQHLTDGGALGECTFERAIPLLDEVNAMATDLALTVHDIREPQWYVTGVEDGDVKRGDNIWYLPDANSKAGALAVPVDVKGILDFVREMRDGVHAALPELAFDELRSKNQVATATVELQLMELFIKINLVRPQYDHAFAHALRLAGRVAVTMPTVVGVEPYIKSIGALDSDRLAFDAKREVIPLDPETRARIDLVRAQTEQARRDTVPAPARSVPPSGA